jgi:hypothetical protein
MNISENNVRFTLKSGHSAVVSAYPRNEIQRQCEAEPIPPAVEVFMAGR